MSPYTSDTVVLVEDHDDTRAAERMMLEQSGYTVVEARTGFDALALSLATRPGVVLLDMILPGIDGCQLARMLRANPSTRGVGLIGLSVSCAPEDRANALDAGCDEFLPKPVPPRRLLEVVRRFVRPM